MTDIDSNLVSSGIKSGAQILVEPAQLEMKGFLLAMSKILPHLADVVPDCMNEWR